MRFTYCPDCGTLLNKKELGDEGMVPWCSHCNKPWFDMFHTCVISLVYNDRREVLLLRQAYISTKYRNLISGYMTPGENAETAAVREIREETGIEIKQLQMVGSWWFEKKQMLMIGFIAKASSDEIRLSSEVDSAEWKPVAEALSLVHPEGSVSYALTALFANSDELR